MYIGTVTICTLGTLLIWNGMVSGNMPALRAVRLAVGIDVAANVRLVTARPFAFAVHLLGKVVSNCKGELGQLMGAFGWDMFSLPLWVRLLYLLVLLFVAVSEYSPKPFLGWERGVLLLVFLGGTFSFTRRWLYPTARSVAAIWARARFFTILSREGISFRSASPDF